MMNRGTILNHTYIKKCTDLYKAILWKSKEISMPENDWDRCVGLNVKLLKFFDLKRDKVLEFDFEDVKEWVEGKVKIAELGYNIKNPFRKEFQEKQYYFPIDLGTTREADNDK